MKMLAIASEGGHWIQLNRLRPLFEEFETVYATTNASLAEMVDGRVYIVQDASAWSKLKLIKTAWQILLILIKERPRAIVTTGAAPGLLAILIGRIVGAKTIWIDSIANSEKMSGSGRLARYCAHKCLTQWEPLRGDRVEYWGRVL